MARSVAASDPVAGVNGRVRQAQALFTALAVAVSSGCLDKVLRRARSPHQRGATPQRRSPGASGSRRAGESGNLGSCRAFADSPGCQDSRFSVPRPGGDLGGRDRRAGRAGAGGNLANWKPGTLGSARRGAGRVDAGPPLPGVPAWGALGRRPWPPPWPGGARPSRRAGMRLQRKPTPVLAKASTV